MNKDGFTLVELVAVFTIVCILALGVFCGYKCYSTLTEYGGVRGVVVEAGKEIKQIQREINE